MNQDEAIQLAIRQVKHIQAQAERIVKGDRSEVAIESFAKYSMELTDFVNKNIPSDEINSYLKELPFVNYKRSDVKLWQYLVFPSWWMSLYKDLNAKNKIIEEIKEARNKYANLELLLKGLTG